MRVRGAIGVLAGALLLASAIAHAFLGWPPFAEALSAAGVDGGLAGGLAVGWYYGSAAMLAFGMIVLLAALAVLRGRMVSLVPVRVIAVVYVAFGVSAFVARDMNPHFLLFVATGVLVGIFAFPDPTAIEP